MSDDGRPSFWQKPEGTLGMVVALGAVGVLLWFLPLIVVTLLVLAQNIVHLSLLVGGLFGAAYVLSDRQNWTYLSYGYQVVMRRLAMALLITKDPIGILKAYVRRLKKRAGHMKEKRIALAGQMATLKRGIEQNERAAQQAVEMAGVAKQRQKPAQFALQARQAGRLRESNKGLVEVYRVQESLLRGLDKYVECAETLAADIGNEVQVQAAKRQLILGSYGIMKEVRAMLSPEANREKELFDQTMEYLVDDNGKKVGEIEGFIEMSAEFIDSLDMKNGVYDAEAMKAIEEWERKGDALLLDSPPERLALPTVEVEKEPAMAPYRRLFEKGGDA